MINKLLMNKNISKKFGEQGKKIVLKNFSLENMLRKHRKVIKSFN